MIIKCFSNQAVPFFMIVSGFFRQENALITNKTITDYSHVVIAPVVADLCTTPVALSAPPNSYQNNS